MIKKKVLLIISVLIVLGGALGSLALYKKYSDTQTQSYIANKIVQIQNEIDSNNLTAAQADIKELSNRSKGLNNKKVDTEVTNLTNSLIKKQNQNQVTKDLDTLSALIKKGSLSEASFEVQKLSGETLSDKDQARLTSLKQELNTAKESQVSQTKEINAMNTLNDLMQNEQYENASNFIENLDTSDFSDANLQKIADYSKQIQDYENKFDINTYKLPTTEIAGFYKEAFPNDNSVVTVSSDIPAYFIGNTPLYKVNVNNPKTPVVYLSPDGKNVSAAQMISASTTNNFFTITNNKKVLTTTIPADAK
ncbi:MAG: hypothetical protein ACRC41_15060 [Sarcina sp.]